MQKNWTIGVVSFFSGSIFAAALLIDYSDMSFKNNYTQYVLIIASIMGTFGILLAPKLNENKAVWLAKWVLALSVPLFSVMLFFKIFFRNILDMNYFSLLGSACTIVAMVKLIQAVKKSKHSAK